MEHKIIILDTSILCVWLKVPGKDTCGSGVNMLDYTTVNSFIDKEIKSSTTLVLPLAVMIEAGNHVAQASGDRHKIAKKFVQLIENTIDGKSPWALFTNQSPLWESEKLKSLITTWKDKVNTGHSFGDASIVEIANFYASIPNNKVSIYTGDKGLEAYSPHVSKLIPRRRK